MEWSAPPRCVAFAGLFSWLRARGFIGPKAPRSTDVGSRRARAQGPHTAGPAGPDAHRASSRLLFASWAPWPTARGRARTILQLPGRLARGAAPGSCGATAERGCRGADPVSSPVAV